MEAKKYDQTKTRMDLVPLSVMESLGKILTMGAQKYGENNWQNLPDYWKRYKAALLRHLTAIDKGELIDSESGYNPTRKKIKKSLREQLGNYDYHRN